MRTTTLLHPSLLAALLALAGPVLAAESLDNSNLSNTYVSDTTPAISSCKAEDKPDTTGKVGSSGAAPCPQSAPEGPALNSAQDAVVRQTLAETEPHSISSVDTSTEKPEQLLQGAQNYLSSMFGSGSPASQGPTQSQTPSPAVTPGGGGFGGHLH